MEILEIIGFITGAWGVYLTLKERLLCFPVGLANVLISLYLFYYQKLYADAIQQVVYIFLLSYGWSQWKRGTADSDQIRISRSSLSFFLLSISAGAVIAIALGYLLEVYTDATFPWIDSCATAAAFVAQWFVAKKKIENWILWIIVNITYISIYAYKGLWFYVLLFVIYLLLSFWGYRRWKKEAAL